MRRINAHVSGLGQPQPASCVAFIDGKVHLFARDEAGAIVRLVTHLDDARSIRDQLTVLLERRFETRSSLLARRANTFPLELS